MATKSKSRKRPVAKCTKCNWQQKVNGDRFAVEAAKKAHYLLYHAE